MSKVSVVMPSYNSEKYISYALNSLINQTFYDWECIIVDDASTDKTLEIIKEYSKKEPRIKYKTFETNTGSAKVPRDTAINMSTSDWIIFLDSDDLFELDVIEKLVLRQIETNADIVMLKIAQIDENGVINQNKFNNRYKYFDFSNILTGKEAVKLTIGEWIIGGFGLFNRKILANRKIIENIFHNFNIDEYDTRQMIVSAKNIAFIDTNYYLRFNSASITRTFNIKKFQVLFTNDLIKKLIEDNFNKNDNIHNKMKYQYICGIIDCRKLLLENKNKIEKDKLIELEQLIKYYYIKFKNYKYNIWSFPFIKKILFAYNYTIFKLTTFILYNNKNKGN